MQFQNILFGLILPFFLFFFLVFALLRRSQIFKDKTIDFGLSFTIAFLGSYWLYVNNLSDIIISSTGITILVVFVVLMILSISLKGYKKLKENYEKEIKKDDR